MYAKSGNIDDSLQIFKSLESKDTAVWNAMLVGLAQHGKGEEAISLFQAMTSSGFQPDKVTFIGVLSACSHSNLFMKSYEHFNAMSRQYGIKPEIEHYSCLVDALARGGLVQEAEKVISSMPFEPSAAMYRVVLSACRIERDAETGRRAAEKLMELEPSDPSPYILLYNIYAAGNRWDEAVEARSLMRKVSVKKDPGFSYVDSHNRVHLFTSDDKSHPQADLIYAKLYEMMRNIKEEGYAPATDVVLLDVEDEEKEKWLWHHSEKLAVAFALVSTPPGKPIRVIKNIRICSDCHSAFKCVSKFYRREIILRDANRFHRIVDGVCSCGDFW
uniref:DYW domain-containing protein n=1 Tax=Kalanchoe fedtschenkoi TaxID=63787 RepID=A0A7N1A0A4_KALFE